MGLFAKVITNWYHNIAFHLLHFESHFVNLNRLVPFVSKIRIKGMPLIIVIHYI